MVNGTRDFTVAVEVHGYEDKLRTELARLRPRHRRAHTEAACLIARRTDDPTRLCTTHRHRQSPQLGMIVLLHRSVEGIHINVYDLTHRQREVKGDRQRMINSSGVEVGGAYKPTPKR